MIKINYLDRQRQLRGHAKTRCTDAPRATGYGHQDETSTTTFPSCSPFRNRSYASRARAIGNTRSTTGRSSPCPNRLTTSAYSAALPIFFFSSRRRHTSSRRDWSSDVCSSDLLAKPAIGLDRVHAAQQCPAHVALGGK